AFLDEHHPGGSPDDWPGPRADVGTRAADDFADSARVEHGVHGFGVDVLPARLAGDADEQSAPPPHGHHVYHNGHHTFGPGTESLFQRAAAARQRVRQNQSRATAARRATRRGYTTFT